jgi:hypothetical protein
MALYSRIYLFIDGQLLAENTTVETALEGDIPDVFTQARQWAGITPAPIVRTVTAENMIPLPGVEFDFESVMLNFQEVEIMMQEDGSGKKCVTKGYIVSVPRSAGVGANSTISFTFRGTPSSFE